MVPKNDPEKDREAIARQLKQVAGYLIEAGYQAEKLLKLKQRLGVNFDAVTELGAFNGAFALDEITKLIDVHGTNLALAADIGNNF